MLHSLYMTEKTPLRDKKKVGKKLGKLLDDKPAKGKKIPPADKDLFDRLTTRAAQPVAKPPKRTSARSNGGD